MSKQSGLPMVDLVLGYCYTNECTPTELSALSFGAVVRLLTGHAIAHPEVITASMAVRAEYEVCHIECHLARIKAYIGNGMSFDGGKPDMPETGTPATVH